MPMPYALRRLREQSPTRYREACRRGGIAAAKARKQNQAMRDQEEDLKQAAAAAIRAREEALLRDSTNEDILTADGEYVWSN